MISYCQRLSRASNDQILDNAFRLGARTGLTVKPSVSCGGSSIREQATVKILPTADAAVVPTPLILPSPVLLPANSASWDLGVSHRLPRITLCLSKWLCSRICLPPVVDNNVSHVKSMTNNHFTFGEAFAFIDSKLSSKDDNRLPLRNLCFYSAWLTIKIDLLAK